MTAKNPVRVYAGEFVGKGLSKSEATGIIGAIIAATPPADLTLSGDVVGDLAHNVAQGIHGDELSPDALAADTDDWNPDGLDDAMLLLVDFAGFALNGMAVPDSPGRVHFCRAVSAGTVAHEAGTSTAEQRFACPGETSLALSTGDAFGLVYLGSIDRWQVVGLSSGSSTSDGMVPYHLLTGDTFTVPLYKQALWETTITVDAGASLVVDGMLIEVT